MKNTLTLNLQLTNTYITICYGKKAYSKLLLKTYNVQDNLKHLVGVSTSLNTPDNKFAIVVGVCRLDNVYDLKSTIVHELSHAVSQWMEEFGINDDEVRSYTLQMIYSDAMVWLDELLKKSVK